MHSIYYDIVEAYLKSSIKPPSQISRPSPFHGKKVNKHPLSFNSPTAPPLIILY